MPVPSPTGVSRGRGGLGGGAGEAVGVPGNAVAAEAVAVGETASLGVAEGGAFSASDVGAVAAAGFEPIALRSSDAGDPPPA